jgi:lipopolysaccharide cholinephosphotransferase
MKDIELKEYDEETLQHLKDVILEIFKDFVKICEKYDLEYFTTGGTAIGALRHNGFIPWDDDIDVNMLREDYNKFMEVAPKEMGDKYIFMDASTQENYPLMFAKMVKRGTRFIEADYEQANYPLGIFIDIFPYDKTPEDPIARKKIIKKTWNIGRWHVLTLIPNPNLPANMNPVLKKFITAGMYLVHGCLKLFHVTSKKTYKKYLKYATNCPEKDSDLYIDYSYITGENLMVRKSDAWPLIDVPFEDTTVKMVKNYDEFLRKEYGDYMELPPEDQRHNHLASYIDFGEE